MNKETRVFIWGLVLLIVCGSSTALYLVDFIKGTFEGWWNYFLLIGSITGTVSGSVKINRTT